MWLAEVLYTLGSLVLLKLDNIKYSLIDGITKLRRNLYLGIFYLEKNWEQRGHPQQDYMWRWEWGAADKIK